MGNFIRSRKNFIRSRKRPFVAQQEEEGDAGQSSPPQKKRARTTTIVSPLKKYKVFISHRGPDVKHSIAYHLFDMLNVRGIHTFFDIEEMEGGEGVSEQIEEAIASSKVQIVIFSKNFGESKWCLEEMRMMMEKRKEGTSTVIPVFYDVQPSEVRSMKGEFGEKFSEEHTQRETVEKIQEWRQALEEVSQISGFCFSQHKGKLVSEVVDEVCKNLQNGITYVPWGLLGRDHLIIQTEKQVMERRKNHYGLTFVEITGIGGIGKTSFAYALYNQIHMHFKRRCIVEDVKGKMEKEGIGEILKILLKTLFYMDTQPINIVQTKSQLKGLLEHEDILIIFDNINHKDKLLDIFFEDFVFLAPSSVIVATSRDANIFKKYATLDNLIKVPIPKLGYTESKMLFCKNAFGAADSKFEERFEVLVDKIVKKCDGMPLALILFGKQVFREKISYWEFFWQKIQDSIPKDLKDVLQITYQSLETELEKQMFLDVAIFFHGDKAQILEDIWVEDPDQCIGAFKIALKNLKRKLLVQITEDGELSMHDVLLDMAKSIVDQEDELEPACRSRLWRPHEVIRVFSDEMSFEKRKGLRGLRIKEDNEQPSTWHTDALVGMSSLKVLIVEGKCIRGDLSKLPRGLLYLKWKYYPYEDVPIPPQFVRVVDLSFGNQKTLWNYGAKEAPIKLRQLILQGCSRIQKIPEWTEKFRLLREVDLSGCSSLQTIPESIDHLQGLEQLNLSWCVELKTLPETFGKLLSLKKLMLNNCHSLQTLPETFGFLQKLVRLEMEYCKMLKRLPLNFGHLRNLEELTLIFCRELRELPENFGRLEMLQGLYLEGCSSLENLPGTFGRLEMLLSLSLRGCSSLESLPQTFGHLKRLKYFFMNECKMLKTLPVDFGHLRSLEQLYLDGCCELKELPENFGRLEMLQRLSLDGCSSLENLPRTFGHLKRLKYLHMNECKMLKTLPVDIDHLRSLERLELKNCCELKELPENFGRLEMLQGLFLEGCSSLENLPGTFGRLEMLLYLSLDGCASLESLPQTFGHLKRLKYFLMNECKMLKTLPVDFGHLRSLEWLLLHGCCELRELPENFGRLEMLQRLYLDGCSSLENLPQTFGHLKRLQTLHMRGCKMLKLVRANFGHLENLKTLSVDIGDLQALLESSGQLKCLSELFITDDCKNLERLPHSNDLLSIEDCPNLKQVDITNCESLKAIDIRDLHSLRVFHVSSCPRLRNIMGLISLDGISLLEIKECMSLTDVDIGSSFHTPFKSLLDMRITVNAELFFQDIDNTEATLSEVSIVSDSRRRSNPKCLFFPLKPCASFGRYWVIDGVLPMNLTFRGDWVIDGVLPTKLKFIGATSFLDLQCAHASSVSVFTGPSSGSYFKQLNETRMTLLQTQIYPNSGEADSLQPVVVDDDGAVRGGWICFLVIEEELREDEKENVWGHFAKEIKRHVHTSLSSTTTTSSYSPIIIDIQNDSEDQQKISTVAIMKHILSV